jgi:hypothetical protein
MVLNYKSPGYVRKRLLLGKFAAPNTPLYPPYTLHSGVPAQIAFAVLISYAAFDWKPGTWTPLMMTLSFWLSMIAHYPLNEEKKPFLQHARSSLVLALVGHLGIVGFIYAIVIPTRLLVRSPQLHNHTLPLTRLIAQAENDTPILTLLTTGVAFPFLAFLFRKVVVRVSPGARQGGCACC